MTEVFTVAIVLVVASLVGLNISFGNYGVAGFMAFLAFSMYFETIIRALR